MPDSHTPLGKYIALCMAVAAEKAPPPRGPRRLWTEKENAIIRTHYPPRGAPACRHYLPGRGLKAIYEQARRLGLRRK